MATATFVKKYPTTLAERNALGSETQQLSGTFADFKTLITICEFPIEYYEENIYLNILNSPGIRL